MSKKIAYYFTPILFLLTFLVGVSNYSRAQAQVPGSFDDGPGGEWCGGIKCPNDYCDWYDGYSGGYFETYPGSLVCKDGSYYDPERCTGGSTSEPCDDDNNPYPDDQSSVCFVGGSSSGCIGSAWCEVVMDGSQCFENYGTWWCCDTPGPSPSPSPDSSPPPDPSATPPIIDCNDLTVDVEANGSDLDITTYDSYTISWTSTSADNCTMNGDPVSTSGSQVFAASVAGTYPYDLDCDYSVVCSDSDSVNVTVNFCGNGACSGFENCSLCSADCGECPSAWWQVSGGNLFSSITGGNSISSDIADNTTCIEPSCVPGLSIQDRAGTTNSDGFPITGGGTIDSNGQMITYRSPDVFAVGTIATRLLETYSYFYSKFSLGLSPTDDYSASSGDALEPTASKDAYFHSGNMTIQSPWDVTTGESYVIFVDGNLTIEDPGAVGELIRVDEGGFLSFIVSGNITIADSVGHSVLSNSAGNIEGVFVADGVINIDSNGVDDKKFVGEGTFAGWAGVGLSRAYDELTISNSLYPAETFIYRPDFVKNIPEKMMRSQMLWQETN